MKNFVPILIKIKMIFTVMMWVWFFFDEDVINYSSIDEKYISVRNYYSNVSFTVEEIGFFC
ncbi:MAG: hypothetical protein VZQ62_01525 [Methanosphaera sp.]|nr:hypothetical protein [Methanosphaera sp.]